MTPSRRFSRGRSTALAAGCLTLIAALTACSSTSTPAPGSAGSSGAGGASSNAGASGKPVHLGMELLLAGLPFVSELQAGGQAAAHELGDVQLDVSAPATFDPPGAISQVNNFLASGVDGVAVAPEPAPLWTRALTDAVSKTKGNTVTLQTPPAASTTVKSYVGIDTAAYGRQVATETIKAAGLGPDTTGEVIIGICTPQSTPLATTVAAMSDAVKQALPKTTVLKPFNSESVPSQNFAAWDQQMRAHPDAVLTLGSCDQDGESMIKAKRVSGGKFAIGGVATTPTVLGALEDGTVAAIVNQNWYVEGYTAIRLLTEAARNGRIPVEGWINSGTTLVTKANVADIRARDASPEGQAAYYKPLITKLWADLPAATKPLSDVQSS